MMHGQKNIKLLVLNLVVLCLKTLEDYSQVIPLIHSVHHSTGP